MSPLILPWKVYSFLPVCVQHVSHQRVLQLCTTQPDAAQSVRFLKLFPAPTLSLLTSVMTVCAEKADVDRECQALFSTAPIPCFHVYASLGVEQTGL